MPLRWDEKEKRLVENAACSITNYSESEIKVCQNEAMERKLLKVDALIKEVRTKKF
jgi:hypothetical protein